MEQQSSSSLRTIHVDIKGIALILDHPLLSRYYSIIRPRREAFFSDHYDFHIVARPCFWELLAIEPLRKCIRRIKLSLMYTQIAPQGMDSGNSEQNQELNSKKCPYFIKMHVVHRYWIWGDMKTVERHQS